MFFLVYPVKKEIKVDFDITTLHKDQSKQKSIKAQSFQKDT